MTNGGVYSSFTLSDDAAIESILTGIPLFCVGIFSIGVFTFLLSLKRVDILSVYLFIFSFLGFIAAIVDLGQILIRGHTNAVNGTGLSGVAGFIRAREVLLAMSTGILFIFFWTFVGARPIGIPSPKQDASATTTSKPAVHCGSWARWGYIGLGLKWTTFLVCVLIGILQIVWRVAPKHHIYGDLYVTSATLETTISAIFILKIFLNFYLSPANYHRQVLLSHIVPILALLVNAGLGIGNLVLFSFSETTLGRFLRAIEVYALIVYFLIVTFRVPGTKNAHKPKSSIDKPPLPVFEKLTRGPDGSGPYDLRNTIPPANPELPRTSAFIRPWRPVRTSTLSKVSSWLSFEPFTSRMQGSSSKDPETALPSSQDKLSSVMSTDSDPSLLFRTTPEPGWVKKPPSADAPQDVTDSLRPPVAPFLGMGGEENRPATEVSLSYYAMESDIRTSFNSKVIQDSNSSIGSESPVYGLDGILPPRRKRPTLDSIIVHPPTASATTSIDNLSPIEELLQQQSELDRSISALRGLHNRQNSKAFNQNLQGKTEEPGIQIITIPPRTDTMTPGSNGVSKPSSTSGHSEFSLSVFPEPPAVETPKLTGRSTLRTEPARGRVGITPIRIPGEDIASAPTTPSQIGVTAKFDSAVTQYDVTSFIGDLTGPNSAYTSGNAIATNSFYKSALSLSDDDNDNSDGQPISARESEKSASPTSTVRSAFAPSSATSTTPPAGRGLGKATMSSSFKAKRPPIQNTEQPAQPTELPSTTEKQPQLSNTGSEVLRSRSGSTRAQPLPGLRLMRSGSLSRTQTGAAPTVRF